MTTTVVTITTNRRRLDTSTSGIHFISPFLLTLFLFLTFPIHYSTARPVRDPSLHIPRTIPSLHQFSEAPDYRNGVGCPSPTSGHITGVCNPSLVHVAMTLDSEYLRGSIAAVHSVLRHASCPENVFFHFIAAEFDSSSPRLLSRIVRSTFPSLSFKVHIFREDTVINLISSSVRQALENPLNYARNYLGDMLDTCVDRVIYLDSDLVLVDDVYKLWNTSLDGNRVIGAPEYCHANFTSYFTEGFWSDPDLRGVFTNRENKPCYFNTGVMVMDLMKWRLGEYRKKIEKWMQIQKVKRIYELGSLPPFLLIFGGEVEPINHRWNQHGLGGDNVKGSCRPLHPGPVSLLHWSGKGKPWVRLDERRPCPLDHLWEPYDLYKPVVVGGGRGGRSSLNRRFRNGGELRRPVEGLMDVSGGEGALIGWV